MIDPTDAEKESMEHAGDMAGEYLESLGKTDLATMSPDEWQTLIHVICSGYVDRMIAIAERHMKHGHKLARKVTADDIPHPY